MYYQSIMLQELDFFDLNRMYFKIRVMDLDLCGSSRYYGFFDLKAWNVD